MSDYAVDTGIIDATRFKRLPMYLKNKIQSAINLNPNKAEYYSNRGATYARMQRYQEGLEDLNKAIQLDPGHQEAYLNRAILYDVMGAPQQAITDLEYYMENQQPNDELYYNLGYFAARANQFPKALSALNNAIKLNPNKGMYYQLRAKVHIQMGNMQNARQDADLAAQYGTPLENSWYQRIQ